MQILDHISYLRGKHAFKFGGEILDNRSTSNETANTKGPLTFDNLEAFFTGFPNGPGCVNPLPGRLRHGWRCHHPGR